MVTISVVCPTFNSSRFIERTLMTIVDQRRKPEEVIISDDGSSDRTLEIVQQFILNHGDGITWKIRSNTHRGPGAARNDGVARAMGEWVAFLDSDDLWHAEKLERVENAILANPQVNFLCHEEQRVTRNGRTSRIASPGFRPDRALPPQLYLRNLFSTSAVTCRRELLTTYGCFDENLMSAQDYELWLRLSPHVRLLFIPNMLGYYIEREGSITSGKLYRRMINEFKIAFRHRNLASLSLFVLRIGRIFLSYSRQYAFKGLHHIQSINLRRTGDGVRRV